MRRWIVVRPGRGCSHRGVGLLGGGWLSGRLRVGRLAHAAAAGARRRIASWPRRASSRRPVRRSSAAVPGTVARVAVAEGDRVAAGAGARGARRDVRRGRDRGGPGGARRGRGQVRAGGRGGDAGDGRGRPGGGGACGGARRPRPAAERRVIGPEAARQTPRSTPRVAGLGRRGPVRPVPPLPRTPPTADEARAAAALDAARAAADRLTITRPDRRHGGRRRGRRSGTWSRPGCHSCGSPGDGGWTFETTDVTQDEVAAIAVGAARDGDARRVRGDRDRRPRGQHRRHRRGPPGRRRVHGPVVEPDGAVPEGVRWNMQASIEIATTP